MNLGTNELLIVVGIVVLLFGGKKIPELMRGVGKGVGELKRGLEEGKRSFETEQREAEQKKEEEEDRKVG